MKDSDFLGEGSFSQAYDIPGSSKGQQPGDLGQAALLTEDGVTALNDLGRGAIKSVGDPSVLRTPKLLYRYKVAGSTWIPGSSKSPPKNFSGGTVSIMEKTPPSFRDFPSNLKARDGGMTPGQAISFNRGMEALNKKGYVMPDNKGDNFTFRRVGPPRLDKWVPEIIDPGTIIPMIDYSPSKARALQQAIDNPAPDIRRAYDEFGEGAARPTQMDRLASEFDQHVDWDALASAVGPKYKTLGNKNLPRDQFLPYNPRNSIDYPRVSKLARETSEAGLKAAEDALRSSVGPHGSTVLPAKDLPPPRPGPPSSPPPTGTVKLPPPDLPPSGPPGRPGAAPSPGGGAPRPDISVLPQDIRGRPVPENSPAAKPGARKNAAEADAVLDRLTSPDIMGKGAVEGLDLARAKEFVKANAGDWPGFRKGGLNARSLVAAAAAEQGIKLDPSQLYKATSKKPPKAARLDTPAKVKLADDAKAIIKDMQAADGLKKRPGMDGLDLDRANSYVNNNAGRANNPPTAAQLAAEAIRSQYQKANPRDLSKAAKGVGQKIEQGGINDLLAKVDEQIIPDQHQLKTELTAGQEHVGQLASARDLISARGRAPSFTGPDGKSLAPPGSEAAPIPPIGRSPADFKLLVPGDGVHLKSTMEGSGYKPTQASVHGPTVNDYVQLMLDEKFPWEKYTGGNNAKVVTVGGENQIVHGHHRYVAAETVSKLTGRPVFGGPNPIIPDNMWRLDVNAKKPPRPAGWEGMAVNGGPAKTPNAADLVQ